MFTFRNLSAVAMFLFGTTFVWMTAAFVGRTSPPRGTLWTIVNVLVLAAVAGFSVAAWGVLRETSWWEAVAMASAVVGLLAVVPYAVAIGRIGQLTDGGVQMNLAIHVGGSVATLAVVLLPALHQWFSSRLA